MSYELMSYEDAIVLDKRGSDRRNMTYLLVVIRLHRSSVFSAMLTVHEQHPVSVKLLS